jgi:hypothetical protein
VLAEADYVYEVWKPVDLRLEVQADRIRGTVNGEKILEGVDTGHKLEDGGIAWVIEVGHLLADEISVEPL